MPFGWVGVEIFFVISGLVIANSAVGATPKSFAVGRFLRLYPAAWCAALMSGTIIFLLTAAPYEKLGIVVSQNRWSFLRSVALIGNSNFLSSAYWTLPVELTFYSLIWLMIYFRQIANIQTFALGLILWSSTYLGLMTLYLAGLVHFQISDLGYGWKTCSLLRHGIFFGLGILVWLLKEKRLKVLGWVVLMVALLMAGVEISYRAAEITFKITSNSADRNALLLIAESWAAFFIAFCAIILSVRFNEWFPRNNTIHKIVRLLGLTTYPFYLLHEALGGFVMYEMHRLGLSYLLSLLVALLSIGLIASYLAAYAEPTLRKFLKQKIPLLV